MSAKVRYSVTGPSTVRVGDYFNVNVNVVDLRPEGTYTYNNRELSLIRGVFAAYCTLLFDKKTAGVETIPPGSSPLRAAMNFRNAFVFMPPYTNGVTLVDFAQGVARLGAFSSEFSGLGSIPYDVVSIRMRAFKAGEFLITPCTAVLKYPMDDTLVYGNIAATPPEGSLVAPEDILFEPLVVSIRV